MYSERIKYFIPKLRNRLAVEKNRIWKHCNVERLSLCGYTPFKSADAFKARLNLMLGAISKNILEGIADTEKRTIIESADHVMRHEFDLLGSGTVKLDPIDWHSDLKSGYHWPKKYYRELSSKPGADIKVPWELSRCQHLLWLGEAYILTEDKRYAQEVINEINWWIDDNPIMYSVNWTCSMDVAFRVVNWMYTLNMISEYEGFNDFFVNKVSKSMWQHGFFVRNNLERLIPYSNNHYTSDIVGLLYLGELFSQTRRGARWLQFALKEYYKETLQQVLNSGVHYERSVSYHRMMTEMLSYPVYMLMRMNVQIPAEVIERIGKMYGYVANYTKPNGLAPLVADNDDGRFLPFLKRDFRNHGYLNDENSLENAIVTTGMQPLFCMVSDNTILYEDAGVAIIKKGHDYLFANNGGYSRYPKENDRLILSHTHNDLLSFELCFDRKDLIVDAGTYLYTSSKSDRDRFRSTSMHNTIVVDEEEQNGFGASFSMWRNVHIGQLKSLEDGAIEGTYSTIEGGMNHQRLFDFSQGLLLITDKITKAGSEHIVRLYLHFAQDVQPTITNDEIQIDNEIKISFNGKPSQLEIIRDNLSPSFGVLVESKTAVATFEFDNEITIITKIKNNG